MTTFDAAAGVLAIVVAVILLDRLRTGAAVVGNAWAAMAVGGGAAAFMFGRRQSQGRERKWIAWSMLSAAAGIALLLPNGGVGLVMVATLVVGFIYGRVRIESIAIEAAVRRRGPPYRWVGAFLTVRWRRRPPSGRCRG